MAVYTKEHMKVKSKKKMQKTTTFFDSRFGHDAAIDIDDFFITHFIFSLLTAITSVNWVTYLVV